jgi:hypothetical protein
VPDGACANATELVAANDNAAQIWVREFRIGFAPSWSMSQAVALAAADPITASAIYSAPRPSSSH